MDSIKSVLKNYNPKTDKYVSREYQSFGVHLAAKLEDEKHKSLYIKMAKNVPRPILEQALRFVSDSGARKKGALFMWKLGEMGVLKKRPSYTTSEVVKPVRTGKTTSEVV